MEKRETILSVVSVDVSETEPGNSREEDDVGIILVEADELGADEEGDDASQQNTDV